MKNPAIISIIIIIMIIIKLLRSKTGMLDKAVDENGVGSTGSTVITGSTGSTKKNSKRGVNRKEKIADKERLLSSYYLVSYVH